MCECAVFFPTLEALAMIDSLEMSRARLPPAKHLLPVSCATKILEPSTSTRVRMCFGCLAVDNSSISYVA